MNVPKKCEASFVNQLWEIIKMHIENWKQRKKYKIK